MGRPATFAGTRKENPMRTYDIQDIELSVPANRAFELIADPANLPRWTEAFASANGASAVMRTPDGEVAVGLKVDAHPAAGTIDWSMTFPDGSVARAHSRVVELAKDRCVRSEERRVGKGWRSG